MNTPLAPSSETSAAASVASPPVFVPDASPASFAAPAAPAAPALELSIDRLVIDCPPGMRPDLLRAEVERQLLAECESRSSARGLPSPRPATPTAAGKRVSPSSSPRIHASRQPADYAARIARAVADRLWP